MFLTRAGAAESRAWRVARGLALVAGMLSLAPVAWSQTLSVELRSRGTQPGDAVELTITAPSATRAINVTAFGASWPAFRVNDTTWRALLGIDLDRKPGAYEVAVTADGTGAATHQPLTVAPKRFSRRVLKVSPDFVDPPPEQTARIARDTEFLRVVYTRSEPEPAWRTGMLRPVAEPANSSFGTRSVFNGQARSPHAGTDFLSPSGTPIHAPAGGRVLGARSLYFTGNTVIIDHGLGVFSMLAHLSRLDVQEGQMVSRGDVVGLVGATGRVTGPHLHWALRVGTARVDPLSALSLFETAR